MGIAPAQQPNVRPVILAEINVAIGAESWVTHSGSAYKITLSENITAVYEDGTALTGESSAANVVSNAATWFYDYTTGVLYVHPTAGASPFSKTYLAIATLYVASKEKVFSNQYYEPRMRDVPRISMRIEKQFGGVGQVSIGSIELANLDGGWDGRRGYLWDATETTVTLKLGYDTATEDMAYGSYTDLGVWAVDEWSAPDDGFRINLRERKKLIEIEIPFDRFSFDTYPNMEDARVGDPIPRAYGRVYGARPILIDLALKKFKVAGHAIKTLDAVRTEVDGVWSAVSFASQDLANGEFTCTDWNEGEGISVDFQAMKNGDGSLMENAADIVEDLLEYAGIDSSDINASAITAAHAALEIGSDPDGNPITSRAITLYMDEPVELVDVIGEINEAVGSFLFINAAGEFFYKVFEPEVGEGLDHYDETDCLSFEPETDAEDIVSKVNVLYAHRREDGWWRLTSATRTRNRYEHNSLAVATLDQELPALSVEDDAEYWAQRHLVSAGLPLRLFNITLPSKGLSILPGDQLRVSNDRRDFNEVLEVLHVELNLGAGTASLLCGNLREWGSRAGFWVSDSAALPTRFASEAGYGSGSLVWNANWSSTIKRWAKQNVGYWTDANGFANSADPDSFMQSTWI